MDLRVARISKAGAALVGAIGCGNVADLSIRGQIERVSITAGCQDNGIGHERFHLAIYEVADHHASGALIYNNYIHHLFAVEHFHLAQSDLA